MVKVFWFAFILSLGLEALASAERIGVALVDQIESQSGMVKLGDFFSKEARTIPQLQGISSIELGVAPRAGEQIKFARMAVSQLISQALATATPSEREALEKFQFNIPKELIAEGAGWDTSVKWLKERLKASIEKACGSGCEAVIEDLITPERRAGIPSTAVIQVGDFNTVPRGPFSQLALIMDGSRTVDRVWIQGRVRLYRWTPVALRLIPSGVRLKEDDFELRRVDLTNELDAPADGQKLVGKKLSRNVAAGRPILSGFISREFDVGYGEPVKGIIKTRDWQIAFEGIARSSALVGDRVQIYNPSTKKVHSGILTAQGLVEIK